MSLFKDWVRSNNRGRTIDEWMIPRPYVKHDVLRGIDEGISVRLAHEYLVTKHDFPFLRLDSFERWVRRQPVSVPNVAC